MTQEEASFAPIEDVFEHLKTGGIVLLAGDPLRGGDIDLMVAAEHADAGVVNFMAAHGRGLICLGISPARAQQLGLYMINPTGYRQSGRPFAVSIEAREGVSTGISAADRAQTIAVAAAPGSSSHDIVRPGHVFPLVARTGGVLERPGAVEAAVDLTRLAGLSGSAVLCSVMNDEGSMARIDAMQDFAKQHGLKLASIDALIKHRRQHDPLGTVPYGA